MHKSETSDRPEIIISKDALEHSTPVGIKNTEIAKTLNVVRVLVARWIKFRQS